MSPLVPLGNPPFPYFLQVINRKREPRRQRLRELIANVNARYGAFVSSINRLECLLADQYTQEQKQDLQHCYVVETTELNNLKAEIIESQRRRCPEALSICQYCGLSHAPAEFDHYLPKDTFPEFSICALNLVPSCGTCNRIKGEAWLDANGRRRIISFYYDQLPTTQFLQARIHMDDSPTAMFYLSSNPADYGGIEHIIRNHFEQLRLLNRFADGAAVIISEARNDIRDLPRPATRADAVGLINEDVRKMLLTYSPNYWKIPLRQAMTASNSFLDYCLA